jgi:anti-sigma B factor antagonist
MPPEISVSEVDRWTVVAVGGELDVYSAPRLREALIDLIGAGHRRLILDMDGVTFIDSTGLGVLIGGLKRLRGAGGELRVVATVEPVVRIMRITGLNRVFGGFASVDAAVSGEERPQAV